MVLVCRVFGVYPSIRDKAYLSHLAHMLFPGWFEFGGGRRRVAGGSVILVITGGFALSNIILNMWSCGWHSGSMYSATYISTVRRLSPYLASALG